MHVAMKGSLTALALLGLSWGMPAVAKSTATCTAHGQAALSAWSQGKYDQVGKDFSAETAKTLPPAKLEAAWNEITEQAGAFKSLGKLQPRMLQGHEVLVAPMSFAKVAGAGLVACDDSDHITTLGVVPASKLPPVTPSSAK